MIAEDAAAEATHLVQSSSNLQNDTQSRLLVSPLPGLKQKAHSKNSRDYPQLCSPLDGEKSLSVSQLHKREKTPYLQSLQGRIRLKFQSVSRIHFIPDQCFQIPSQGKLEVLPVGSRLKHFLPYWEKQGVYRSILCLIRDGYKLPFGEHPELSRFPCIINVYAGSDKQGALWTYIQDLLQKGAMEVMHTDKTG